jgi:hypothetical protein
MEKCTNISGDWIKDLIQDFIATSPHNTMQTKEREPAWDTALVGFASGADPIWQQYKDYASSWSERHAAHAAGLGTFGLCDGLITAKGKAMQGGIGGGQDIH